MEDEAKKNARFVTAYEARATRCTHRRPLTNIDLRLVKRAVIGNTSLAKLER